MMRDVNFADVDEGEDVFEVLFGDIFEQQHRMLPSRQVGMTQYLQSE